MRPKPTDQCQLTFYQTFEEQLDHQHPLYPLANAIQWSFFEERFTPLYSANKGRPAKPIRRMVGLLILKHLRDISDEQVVLEWSENVYYQYFCGEQTFAAGMPCEASELVHFRQRIGSEVMALILADSIRLQGADKDEDKGERIVDTTVQPKNITFPTDDKLRKKIIHPCKKIAQEEGVKLPRTYRRELKRLSYLQRFRRTREQRQQARKADKRILTIARKLVQQWKARLDEPGQERHKEQIALFERVLAQKKHDEDKVYSLHEPHVQCIAKGKAHVAYEFGTKVSFIIGKHSGIIYGALNIKKNDYDGHTLAAALEQFEALNGYRPRRVLADLGYRGRKTVQDVEVLTPDALKRASGSQRYRFRRAMHRRSSVEATI